MQSARCKVHTSCELSRRVGTVLAAAAASAAAAAAAATCRCAALAGLLLLLGSQTAAAGPRPLLLVPAGERWRAATGAIAPHVALHCAIAMPSPNKLSKRTDGL